MKWILLGIKKVLGSEAMVAPDLVGELTVTATITAGGGRELDFAMGAGLGVECNVADLNESVWGYLETIHRSLAEGKNLPIKEFRTL